MIIGVVRKVPDTDITDIYLNVKLLNILDQTRTQNRMLYLKDNRNMNILNPSTHEQTVNLLIHCTAMNSFHWYLNQLA